MAGKPPDNLNLPDGTLPPVPGIDVPARARALANSRRQAPLRDARAVACYRSPSLIRRCVKMLSNLATHGVLEPASTAILEAGIRILWSLDGVAEIMTPTTACYPPATPRQWTGSSGSRWLASNSPPREQTVATTDFASLLNSPIRLPSSPGSSDCRSAASRHSR